VRVACLRVADLPLAAERRAHPERADLPFVLASGRDGRAFVVAVSPEAARRGLRPGVPVAHARAACGEVEVRVPSPALLRTARQALLDAALSVSPRVAELPPASGVRAGEAALVLDASGAAALHRSERGLAGALAARAHAVGLPAAVAVASSRRVAHLLARQLSCEAGEVRVLPPGGEREALSPLPVDALDLPDAAREALTRFGVRRVGELLALPRRGLAARLGPEVTELLAALLGEESEGLPPVPVSSRLAEAVDLEHPVDRLEPLVFVARGALSRLLARLTARRLACGDLGVTLALDGGGRDARRIGVAAPTLDERVLLRLFSLALEARPPGAPVEGLTLETEGRPTAPDQLDLFRPAGPAPAALGRTLAELASLCGADRVGAPRVADDWRPEAFALSRFEPAAAGAAASGGAHDESGGSDACLCIRALRPPVPAEVRVRGGRPAWIRSAAANGRIVRVSGPWRSSGLWWSEDERFAYDHFDVQTSDATVARLRLDRLRRRWHVDAIYD